LTGIVLRWWISTHFLSAYTYSPPLPPQGQQCLCSSCQQHSQAEQRLVRLPFLVLPILH
jgi:hypothetical protein